MTDKLKPVNCGCGGEPVVGHIEKTSYVPKDRWYIGCPKCDICTGIYDTEAEAVEVWNRAMGAKDINVPNKERNKGKWLRRKGEDCWECSECHAVLENSDVGNHNFYYCYHCGADMMNKSGYMDIEEVHYE